MKTNWKIIFGVILTLLLGLVMLGPGIGAAPSGQDFFVSKAVSPHISPPASSLPALRQPEALLYREINPRKNPLLLDWDMLNGKTDTRDTDPLLKRGRQNTGRSPDLLFSFDGLTTQGYIPPDTIGDVGPNHYLQMINVAFAIFDKSGHKLTGPTNINALWQGAGGNCELLNKGDPVVLYDSLADRWLLSQFTYPKNDMCIAISQTPDPTGSYYLYQFDVGAAPDYFKFGLWPDGYYMSANENSYTAYAFDRVNMLAGNAATFQKFSGQTNLLLPGDLDGSIAPPVDAPSYFYTFKDGDYHGASDRLEIFEFAVDWGTPANSTFNLAATIPLASFNYTVCGFFKFECIPQAGTAQKLDAVSEWPMWRLQYRNFGSYETLVGNFSVDVDGQGQAGIRWFELHKSGEASWTLHQEGTHAPDSEHRWMGSIAMDREGNIALGYSSSSSASKPSIRYAARLAGDPAGTLQSEATLIAGEGSQTGSNRWGDYSSLNVDPADDCSFWYTNEYYAADSRGSWRTRVGVFKIAGCGVPSPKIALSKTVGLDSEACAATNEIMVDSGTEVIYCYQAKNTGNLSFTTHSLIDSQLGVILSDEAIDLIPGQTIWLTRAAIITANALNTAVWTAANMTAAVQATDVATVSLNRYEVELASDQEAYGARGSRVTYTLSISNKGNITDSFAIAVANTWPATVPSVMGPLTAGQSISFTAQIEIPAAAKLSDRDTAVITASSQSDAGAADSVFLITSIANQAPVAQSNYFTVAENSRNTLFDVLANDADPDPEADLSIIALTSPDQGGSAARVDKQGSLALPGKLIAYTPAANFSGAEVFTYTVSDGALDDSASVAVAVLPGDTAAPLNPISDTTIVITETQTGEAVVVIDLPAGSVSDTVTLLYSLTNGSAPPSGGFDFAGISFTLDAYLDGLLQSGFIFNAPITLTLQYREAEIEGLSEDTLRLRYWDEISQSWADDGITLVGHNLDSNTAIFALSHLSNFGLFGAPEPSLSVAKRVEGAGGGAVNLPRMGVITYTITLSNSSPTTATNVVLTDTLPDGLSFGDWIQQNGAEYHPGGGSVQLPGGSVNLPDESIAWGAEGVISGAAQVFIFTASIDSDAGGDITNRAWYSSLNAGWGWSNEARISVKPTFPLYLPLVMK